MKVRFGVIADLHSEVIPDSTVRMRTFLNKCQEYGVDFCVQLGDFCPPGDTCREQKEKILDMIKKFESPFYHVIGNHDTDENSKAKTLSYIDADRSHFSFDCGGLHFVILDACYYSEYGKYHSYNNGNYRAASKSAELPVSHPEELEWLKKDLAGTAYRSVIFSHQSLIESRTGIRNPEDFRKIAENAPNGVMLSVCGHEHVDRLEFKNGIAYYCLNSASYYWAGSKYSHSTYGEGIESEFPYVRKVFPYKKPLYAIVDIDDERVSIRGTSTEFVGASPREIDFRKYGLKDKITPAVKNRRWKINNKQN